MRLLFVWLGNTDISASVSELDVGIGPIAQALEQRDFDQIYIISDHDDNKNKTYIRWLESRTHSKISLEKTKLSSPTEFSEIYEVVYSILRKVTRNAKNDLNMTFHLSPGTPAMAAVWILMAKTAFPAELIESSLEAGVRTASFPFDLSAEYTPPLRIETDDEIFRITQGLPPKVAEFDAIIHRCESMKRLVAKARKISIYDIPVLILGESGTGKELLARAIHSSSLRKNGPFVAVDCGAIPGDLLEAEFFGYEKGAFTGAIRSRVGYIENADSGTLFLDEVGELPLSAQVKLLRSLQENSIKRIGSTSEKKVDIRIIAATNKALINEVTAGNFREDLFHRLAVGVLEIPPLRERKGDFNPLIDNALKQINEICGKQGNWQKKKLSAGARNILLNHTWPGNVRELINTLSRLAVWASRDTIEAKDVTESLFPLTLSNKPNGDILNRDLGEGLSLLEIVSDVIKHYLTRALKEAHGNKSKAAELVGLPSYQTLTNWLKKYGIEG